MDKSCRLIILQCELLLSPNLFDSGLFLCPCSALWCKEDDYKNLESRTWTCFGV